MESGVEAVSDSKTDTAEPVRVLSSRWSDGRAHDMDRFLALDGLCDEDEINRRLSAVTDDVAGVRRMLVDTGWLERDRAGTTYGPGRPLPDPVTG